MQAETINPCANPVLNKGYRQKQSIHHLRQPSPSWQIPRRRMPISGTPESLSAWKNNDKSNNNDWHWRRRQRKGRQQLKRAETEELLGEQTH